MVNMKKLKEEALQRQHEHLKKELAIQANSGSSRAKNQLSNKNAIKKQPAAGNLGNQKNQRKKFKLSLRVIELLILLLAGFLLVKLFNPFS